LPLDFQFHIDNVRVFSEFAFCRPYHIANEFVYLLGRPADVITHTEHIPEINLGKDESSDQTQTKDWLIPVLSLIGLGVAGYLAYVEVNQVEAICGPVGNCNTVQQSSYAMLFGIFPIGVLGVLGYLVIIILWLTGNLDLEVWQKTTNILLWIITLIGVLFSVYLTFLEPFVIGATCLWCLSSAVIMTILFLIATQNFKRSLVIVSEES